MDHGRGKSGMMVGGGHECVLTLDISETVPLLKSWK